MTLILASTLAAVAAGIANFVLVFQITDRFSPDEIDTAPTVGEPIAA